MDEVYVWVLVCIMVGLIVDGMVYCLYEKFGFRLVVLGVYGMLLWF